MSYDNPRVKDLSILRKFVAAVKRPPDFIIGHPDKPYLLRWWIIPRNRLFNVYLHKFVRDDDDRALHDHPWVSLSIILRGGYIEHLVGGIEKHRRVGSVIFRRAKTAHRVELYEWVCDPDVLPRSVPAWTLFITGPRIRQWGFHCPKGWVHWKTFCDPENSGAVGKGCP